MPSLIRSLLFVATTTLLALSVFPVMAQVIPINAPNCGFLGMNCTGGETFLGNIGPYLVTIINTALGLIGTIAAGFLVVAGYLYVTSTGDTDKAEKAKHQIIYALLGLIVAFGAYLLVGAVTARTAAPIALYLTPFINMAIALIGTAAGIALIYGGYTYIMSSGEEDKSEQAKKIIFFALLGIIVAFGAYVLVGAVTAGTAAPIIVYLTPFINMAMALVGTAAGIALIYGGYTYIMSRGEEDKSEQAKRVIFFAILGIIVALGVNIILSAFIDPATGALTANAVPLDQLISTYGNLALTLVGIVAAVFLVYAGFLYISSTGDEENSTRARRQIIFALLGIFVAGAAGLIVNVVVIQDATLLIASIRNVVNAVLTILGIAAAVYIVVGGVMYISSTGDSDKADRARLQIIYAVIGLVVVALSGVLVNLVIGSI